MITWTCWSDCGTRSVGREGQVDIALGRHGGQLELRVSDDGPGIPQDKLPKIFEPYFTTKEKGTGLGLAIVKHNTELYNGTVHVESAVGKGTCFTVLLPAKSIMKIRT